MIAVKPNNLETVMEVVINGKITKEDMEKFENHFKQEKESKEKLNLLLSVHDLKGYSLHGLIEDLKFMALHSKKFNKVAVFADEKWIELSVMVSKYLPGIEVEHFNFGKREQAIEWLEG